MSGHIADRPATAATQGTTALRPEDGPWFIRSHYWGRWHCNRDGSAAGYTDDILRAGIFDYDVARHYNDWTADKKRGRDEAIPAARMLEEMERRRADIVGELTAATLTLGTLRKRLSDGAGLRGPASTKNEAATYSEPKDAPAISLAESGEQ